MKVMFWCVAYTLCAFIQVHFSLLFQCIAPNLRKHPLQSVLSKDYTLLLELFMQLPNRTKLLFKPATVFAARTMA